MPRISRQERINNAITINFWKKYRENRAKEQAEMKLFQGATVYYSQEEKGVIITRDIYKGV